MYAPMREFDEVPIVLASKSDWMLEDVDGNTFADHLTCWGSTPLGAAPATVEAAVADAQSRYGMEITDYVTCRRRSTSPGGWSRSRRRASPGSRTASAARWRWSRASSSPAPRPGGR